MCFKCHRIGHYANKCQKQKPLVTLEKVETEPEKEDHLPIFDDYEHEPKEGSDGEQNHDHQEGSSSIQKLDQTQGEHCADYNSFAYNPFPFNVSDLRTNLFEEGEYDRTKIKHRPFCFKDTTRSGDLVNQLDQTKVSPPARADHTDQAAHSKTHGRARLSLGREETEDGYAFSSGQSRTCPYLYPVHPSCSNASRHLDES
ncbi:uncharacterized protein LOC130503621 [Raphanus sativus]|uniref:Uncharacterized protein LOC130503621 n=1 Tax=Raphanus sativus TaxID=3726 RepID=A0A9W3CRV6_RAPSA|nr:uncharacterized protein LOC130503621 [Raphanus sativus]